MEGSGNRWCGDSRAGQVGPRVGRTLCALCMVLAGAAGLAGAGTAEDLPAGERLKASDTRRIGTVLGYGREMLRSEAPPSVAAEAAGGDILWGADIGLPVTIEVADGNGGTTVTTFLFFGDTDLLDHQELVDHGRVRPYQAAPDQLVAPFGVLQGDGIGLTTDLDPEDGLALSHVLRNREPGESSPACSQVEDRGFRAMYVPTVHPGPCAAAQTDGQDVFWIFNTPTGAWALDDTLLVMVADQTFYDGIPQASSYLAASTDYGLTWKALNGGHPFSSPEVADWPLAKFVHVDAVPVDAADYQDASRSGPCLLPLPGGDDTRGYLLFGGGLWTQSDVYLAFLSRSGLEDAVASPSTALDVWYFAGVSTSGCWSRDQADAIPVVNGFDNTSFARYELPCGNHVIEDTVGMGYISVVQLDGELSGGRRVDRLLMLFNSGYVVCLAGEGDACCGGTPVDGGRMCSGVDFDTYADRIAEGNAGIVFISGERWRPWIWNTSEPPSDHTGDVAPASSRPLAPVTIPPDPAANWYGAGPACKTVLSDTDVINGYAPLAIDRLTRVSASGDGFDLYFLLSRWGAKRTPDDPGKQEEGYNYIVDLFRTRIRPAGVPRVARVPKRVQPAAQSQGLAAARGRRGEGGGGVRR